MNDFIKIVIFYFSGTGNAKQIAQWFSENASNLQLPCNVFNIATITPSNFPHIEEKSLILIISPIHGFNYPKITLNFIRHFPKGNQKIVLMNTRAGMKLGKWVTPGLTGIAFILSSVILKSKGYSIIGQIPFDMPSNWISLHPALTQKTVQYLHIINKQRVENHAKKIYNLQKDFLAYQDLLQDILISPIALGYYFVGRFAIAKTFYASTSCDKCELCIKQCPVNAIKMVENRPYWTFKCESCMHCMNFCPKKAIETAHGFIVAVSVLTSMVFSFISHRLLQSIIHTEPLATVVASIIFLSLIWLFYWLQHALLHYRFFAKIIELFSFTKLKCWGRYKSTNTNKE